MALGTAIMMYFTDILKPIFRSQFLHTTMAPLQEWHITPTICFEEPLHMGRVYSSRVYVKCRAGGTRPTIPGPPGL